jgi:hypothetical protein
LTYGPFVENWFELWDTYDKWLTNRALKLNEKVHAEKDDQGRSLHAIKGGEATHEEKDEQGRSLHNLKLHEDKDEDGKSSHAVKMAKVAHKEKDEQGRSITSLKGLLQKWECLECGMVTIPGNLGRHQKAKGHTGREKVTGLYPDTIEELSK